MRNTLSFFTLCVVGAMGTAALLLMAYAVVLSGIDGDHVSAIKMMCGSLGLFALGGSLSS